MNTVDAMVVKLISVGLCFGFIFLTGFWLSRTGKPYSTLGVTIHKLIGLGMGIFLLINVYRLYRVNSLNLIGFAAILVTGIFFIGLAATGGLLSAEKPMPEAVSMMHKAFPYLATLSSGATLYILT